MTNKNWIRLLNCLSAAGLVFGGASTIPGCPLSPEVLFWGLLIAGICRVVAGELIQVKGESDEVQGITPAQVAAVQAVHDSAKNVSVNIGKIVSLLFLTFFLAISAMSQTNTQTVLPPGSLSTNLLGSLNSYLTQNDPSFNGWASNHFTLWQAATFQNVNGVAGASSIGNDLGLEVPIHKYSVHIDSVTGFEQLFGDVHYQQFGLGYDYNIHQIHLSGGLDARYLFTGNSVRAVPYAEFIKMPTSLYGVAPFLRYSYPVTRRPGAGEIDIGLAVNF